MDTDQGFDTLARMAEGLAGPMDAVRSKLSDLINLPIDASLADNPGDTVADYGEVAVRRYDEAVHQLKDARVQAQRLAAEGHVRPGMVPPACLHHVMESVNTTLHEVFRRLAPINIAIDQMTQMAGPAVHASAMKVDQYVIVNCRQCAAPVRSDPADPKSICADCEMPDGGSLFSQIPARIPISQCRHCERWEATFSGQWMRATYESPELMKILLGKIPALKKIGMDTQMSNKYLYSEPNSMQINMAIGLRGTVGNYIKEETKVVCFRVSQSICGDCERDFTPHTWRCTVSIRQRNSNKATLRRLEELIRPTELQAKNAAIEPFKDGFDMKFNNRADARSLVNFVRSNTMVLKSVESDQLISHNANDNTSNRHYTWSIELVPFSKYDLVYLPKVASTALGGVPRFMVVQRVSKDLVLMDPLTFQSVTISSDKFNKLTLHICSTPGHLRRYLLANREERPLTQQAVRQNRKRFTQGGTGAGRTTIETKTMSIAASRFNEDQISFSRFQPMDLELLREGTSELVYTTTHLGLHMRQADILLGYELDAGTINVGGEEEVHAQEAISKMTHTIFIVGRAKSTRAERRESQPGEFQSLSSRANISQRLSKVQAAGKTGGYEQDVDWDEMEDMIGGDNYDASAKEPELLEKIRTLSIN